MDVSTGNTFEAVCLVFGKGIDELFPTFVLFSPDLISALVVFRKATMLAIRARNACY